MDFWGEFSMLSERISPRMDAVVIVLLDDLPLLDAEEHAEVRLHGIAGFQRPKGNGQSPHPSRFGANPVPVRGQALDGVDMLGDDMLAFFEVFEQGFLPAGLAV